MRHQLFLLIVIVNLVCFSCAEKHTKTQTINVDFTNIREVSIDTTNIVLLETNENSLLYDICALEQLGDTIFIFSRNVVRAFDKNGKYLFDLSRKGQGPDEYESIENIYSKDGHIYLYDNALKRLLCFSADGTFIEGKRVVIEANVPSPVSLFPFGDKDYISMNSFSGDDFQVPVFSIWNKELNKQQEIGGRKVSAGLRLSDYCYIDGNQRVLYWEPAKDTLFTVIDHLITPLYPIDFGVHSLPISITQKDVYERVMFMSKEGNEKYATLARYYQTYNDWLFFTCAWNKNIYLCRYNEKTMELNLFKFSSPENHFSPLFFFKIIDNKIFLEMKDNRNEEINHSLFIFPLELLGQ